jgi:hypothetical protein
MNIKGSTLIPRLEYLQKQATEEQMEKVYKRLRPPLVEVLKTGIMATRWYPVEDMLALSSAMDVVLGQGDKKLIWELGRFSAEFAARGIYKIFYKFGSPEWIIKKTLSVWRQYYDAGEVRVIEKNSNGVHGLRICISGLSGVPSTLWLSIGGWVEKSLELSGGKNVKAVIAETLQTPGTNCEIDLTWN